MPEALKRKKIAVVSDSIYPFNKGGKEKRMYDVTTRLAAQGNDVTIYCMKWWKGPDVIKQDGVTLHAISPLYKLYAGNRRSMSEAIFFALHCFKLLGADFDIVDVDHMPHLVLFTMKIVCVLKRKRMIVTWHEVWGKEYWKTYLGSLGLVAYAIEKISAGLPDLIISVSDHTTNALRNTLKVKQEIVTVPNGLDVRAIINNIPGKRASDIVFAGRLLSHKNVDVLLQALAIVKKTVPNISMFVIGEGPEKENLEKLTNELGLQKNVSFLGFLEDHNDLYGIMHSSRLFALPSTREGFGIAVIEANACGLPAITIDHHQNAAKELIVHGENGMLCALKPTDLAEAILVLLNGGRKSAAAYQKYAEKYNWDKLISKIENVYAL